MSTSLYTYDPNKCDGHYCPGDCDECKLGSWGRFPCSKATFIQGAKISSGYYVEIRGTGLRTLELDCIFCDKKHPNGAYKFVCGNVTFCLCANSYGKLWRVWGEHSTDEPDEDDMECAPWST
jgi:hypothetical protein